MKPGNKSLFLNKISPKFHFFCSQTCLHSKCMGCMLDLQLVFQMAHNLHSGNMIFSIKAMGKMIRFEEIWTKIFIRGHTWHSKWHEDLLSCVRVNDGLWHKDESFLMLPPAQGWIDESGVKMKKHSITCLIFWASHNYTAKPECH